MVIIRATPRALARAMVSGSDGAKSGKSRWQWVSMSMGRLVAEEAILAGHAQA